MKHFAALAVFAAAAPAFAQERVASNYAVQEFPRWHSIAQVLNRKNNSTGARYLPSDLVVAVDFKNVTHVAGIATNAALGASGSGSNVFYVNDEWIDRRSSGFSTPVQVSNVATNSPARDVEIVAMSDGAVYVVWSEDRNVGGHNLEEIYYRKRNADGSWNSITSTGAATLSTGTELFRNLRTLLTGSVFRMTFTRETSSATTLEYEYDPTASWGPETISDSSSTGYVPGGSNLAMKPDSSDIFVVFEDLKDSVTIARYCVRYESTSSWDSINDLYEGGLSPDIKFKSNYGAVYCVIVGPDGPSGDIGKVLYRVGSGDWVHIGNTNTATAAFDCARLVVDNQDRPHILWRYSAGSPTYTGLGYALRMEGTGSWTRQEGIQEVGRANLGPSAGSADWSLGSIDLAIDGHGNPVWIDATSGLLSRSYEPNLGAQDPFTETAAGPAATGNGATGNLHLEIPLFSTSGVGYAVRFSLVHNSLAPSWGVMSGGWAHNYHVYLVDSATGYNNSQDVITLVGGDGRRVIFRYNSTYSVHLADAEYAVFSKLERLSSTSTTDWVYSRYRLTTKFGEQAEFRADGKIEKLTDLNGNTMHFWYAGDSGYTPSSTKPQGALVEIEDSLKNLVSSQAGRKTKLLYNSDRQLASVQDPMAQSANYTLAYNSTSKRLETLTFEGEADIDWTFTYHSADDVDNKYRAGFLNVVKTPRGTLGSYGTSYRWYLDNRIAKAIDPEVTVVVYDTYDYDPEANSPAREFLYSDPVEPFDDPNEGAPTTNDVPTFTYRDRRTRDWIVEYQQRRCIADNWTDPDEESEVLTHDGTYRNLTLHEDREGRKTRYTWHTSTTPAWVGDNLWKVELPESSTTYRDPTVFTYTTDGFNRVATVTDPLGEVTDYDYDSYGNLETIDYPDVTLVTGSTQTASEAFTYTTRGRIESWTDAEGNEWTWNYEDDDATGLVTKIQEPGQSLANARKFEYDAMGNLWKVTAPPNNLSGGVTEFVRDGLHRVETVIDPLDYEIGYTYDADSNVTQVEDRRANVTTFEYDHRGDLASVETPAGETTFVYDREQQIRRTTNPRGYTSKAIYDLTGRLSQTTQPTDAGDRVVDYTYNAAGQVTITDFEAVSNTTTYCNCTCPTQSFVKASQEATTVQRYFDETNRNFAWNNLSGSSSPTFDFGQHTDFDERGRVRVRTQLTEAYSGSGSPTGKPTRYLHDKNGRVTQIWNPNGTTSSNAHSVRFAYDSRGRLYQVKDAYGNIVEQREYYEDNSLRYVKGQEPLVGGLITVRTLE